MKFSEELIQELELLSLYELDSLQQGLKIHHEAPGARIEAARRLFRGGLITQEDGGFLTDRGLEAAEHLQAALSLLSQPGSRDAAEPDALT